MTCIEEEKGCLWTQVLEWILSSVPVFLWQVSLLSWLWGEMKLDILGSESGTYCANTWDIFKMIIFSGLKQISKFGSWF